VVCFLSLYLGVARYKRDSALWALKWWKPLYWALGFTCAMFLVRLLDDLGLLRLVGHD
jgi:hypothetical protein